MIKFLLKNKIYYLYVLFFLICSIIIDYNLFINKNVEVKIDTTVINKSSIIITYKSNTIEANSKLYEFKDDYSSFLVNDILVQLRYLIKNSEIGKTYYNQLDSRYVENNRKEYFTLNYDGVTQDWFYGRVIFRLDTYSTIANELIHDNILNNISKILESSNAEIFKLIDNYTKQFILYEKNNLLDRINNKIFFLEKSTLSNNDIEIFTLYNKKMNNSKKRHLFKNFVPVFTLLTILLIFIFFIYFVIKNNKNE
jgi:hypothetical protein